MDQAIAAPATPPMPLTAHLNGSSNPASEESYAPPSGVNLGRDRINLNQEVWERIDRAVAHEAKRTRIAAKFLPIHRVEPHTTTVAADVVSASFGGGPLAEPLAPLGAGAAPPLFNVDEGLTTRLIETWVDFSLTPSQVEQENRFKADQPEQTGDQRPDSKSRGIFSTAVTLAVRAANALCQAEDAVVFQGQNAFPGPTGSGGTPNPPGSPLFSSQTVLYRGTPADYGLTNIGNPTPWVSPQLQIVPQLTGVVPQPASPEYSENTVGAINTAYSVLQNYGHYAGYACVLYFYAFADSYKPLPTTLILPADRILPLMTEGYFGTGTLPGTPNPVLSSATPPPTEPQMYGLVVATAGNTMDLVIGLEPVTAFVQQDPNGNFRFRVLERFCLRFKDLTAGVLLAYQ